MIFFCELILLSLDSCREIDFVNETVRTLAGNGTKGSDYIGGAKGSTQARLKIFNLTDNILYSVNEMLTPFTTFAK